MTDPSQLEEAFARCASEARAAFGSDALYVERLIRRARHIEVQVIGDGARAVHLHERDCTLQRSRQKIVEIAPGLDPALRDRLLEAALTLAGAKGYRSLGTFEFLVDRDSGDFAFMEANPRLQVEHTVTEEATGLDLVKLQLRIARGETLADLGLTEPPALRGHAIQLRINAETMGEDGSIKPSSGTLEAFDAPSGRGVRVDTAGFAGGRANPAFDTLLAKLIAYDPSPDYADALRRAYRALCEFRVEGVRTNIPLLRNLLTRTELAANDVDTGFLEARAAELLRDDAHPVRHAAPRAAVATKSEEEAHDAPPGAVAVEAPLEGTVVAIQAEPAPRSRPAQEDRPAHCAREHRGPDRRGQLRRIRGAGRRGPPHPLHDGGADRAHPRRRAGRGRRLGQRRAVPGRRRALRGHVLRLHRARRHAGVEEPREDGPDARHRAAPPPAAGVLHRGRRRAPRRHRPHQRGWPDHPQLRADGAAVGPCADGRHRVPAAASRATPRRSASATSSSPPRTPTSAWAARR